MSKNNSSLAHILKEVCLENKNKFENMTEREKEIMALMVNGYNSEAMGIMLGISKNTINTHRKNINKKTKLKSPKEFVLFALAFDLL